MSLSIDGTQKLSSLLHFGMGRSDVNIRNHNGPIMRSFKHNKNNKNLCQEILDLLVFRQWTYKNIAVLYCHDVIFQP